MYARKAETHQSLQDYHNTHCNGFSVKFALSKEGVNFCMVNAELKVIYNLKAHLTTLQLANHTY
jgi:hypothetical protein